MGDVVKFRKRPRNHGQFRGQGSWKPNQKPQRPRERLSGRLVFVCAALFLLALSRSWWSIDHRGTKGTFTCQSVSVIDGDTFNCDGQRVRMAGIDAPELPGHCRPGRDCTPGDPFASTDCSGKARSNAERWKWTPMEEPLLGARLQGLIFPAGN